MTANGDDARRQRALELRRAAGHELVSARCVYARDRRYLGLVATIVQMRSRFLDESAHLDPEGHARWQRRQKPHYVGPYEIDRPEERARLLRDAARDDLDAARLLLAHGLTHLARNTLENRQRTLQAAALLEAQTAQPSEPSDPAGRD